MLVALLIITLVVIGFFIKNRTDNYGKETVDKTVETTKDSGEMIKSGNYLEYSEDSYGDSRLKKRVLFFHAKWCPTCKVANEEFTDKQNNIPDDVVLFKVDYDTESELKKRYGITYQHTFVLVDDQGNEIRKWNGGGLSELISNTK
jgi:thiol-disulfide isomerase/thioredoxin